MAFDNGTTSGVGGVYASHVARRKELGRLFSVYEAEVACLEAGEAARAIGPSCGARLMTLLLAHERLAEALLLVQAPPELTKVDAEGARSCVRLLGRASEEVSQKLPQDADAAVYYKTVAEVLMWAGSFGEASLLLGRAERILEEQKVATDKLSAPVYDQDTLADLQGELDICQEMMAICQEQLQREKHQKEERKRLEEKLRKKAAGPDLRRLRAADARAVDELCKGLSVTRSLLPDATGLVKFLQANEGLCWGAESEENSSLAAVIAATTDGTFGYLQEVWAPGGQGVEHGAIPALRAKVVSALQERGVKDIHSFSSTAKAAAPSADPKGVSDGSELCVYML
ncbi:unnamed protein product [Polarella glacialis]|uniref:Uncharacterized protein n=1 Tax=Polarella glacialis TaxID=89957 RepID=A0A813GKD0_POLGL|nr:unnamed protein product [Polarella glacialis]